MAPAFLRRMVAVRCSLLILSFLGMILSAARGTSVIPPEFSELVGKADSIVRGEVTAIRSEWTGLGETRRIVTLVTVRIERTLVGQVDPDHTVELEFLGGTVGVETLEVSGMPRFQVGSRDILFVQKNGSQMCPLVGFNHGRYLIVPGKDAQQGATIARNNRVPLESVGEVVLPMGATPASQVLAAMKRNPMTVSAFEAAVIQQAVELGRKDVVPVAVQQ